MTTYRKQLFEIALDQYGYVTSKDAHELGIPVVELGKLASRGQLARAGHGIYRIPELPIQRFDSYMLATLWTGGRGVLSHDTMLDLYELCDINPSRVHLTVPPSYRPRRKGGDLYTFHHADLKAEQVDWFEGIPAVTPRTAIYQCVESGTPIYLLRQAIEAARKVGVITSTEQAELVARLEGADHDRPPDE